MPTPANFRLKLRPFLPNHRFFGLNRCFDKAHFLTDSHTLRKCCSLILISTIENNTFARTISRQQRNASMASSSSLGNASLANATSAQAFYTQFRTATSALLEELQGVTTKQGLQDGLQKYAALSGELTRAVDSGVLPAHDREVHRRGLEEVANALEQKRKAVEEGADVSEGKKKRGGFAFKRKPPSQSQPQRLSESTSTVETDTASDAAPAESKQHKTDEPTIRMTNTANGQESNHLTISWLHNTSYKHNAALTPPDNGTRPLSIDIAEITNSVVDLRPLATTSTILSVQLRQIASSILLLPPIDGSIMIHHLTSSLLVIPSCHQYRMHNSEDTLIELSTKRGSVVTVEACQGITFLTSGSEGLRVQDFDDLINSEQLKLGQGDSNEEKKGNFRTVKRGTSDLAEKANQLFSEGLSTKDCIERITNELSNSA